MDVSIKQQNGLTVLFVDGRLDTASVRDFENEYTAHLEAGTRIVLDLSRLEYISSAGIRAILLLAKELKNLKGSLAVSGLSGMVKEVFSMTGCDTLFPVFETASEAERGNWSTERSY